MCARVVFNLILNKLESRQTNRVKRQVIGAARFRDRERVRAHISERREPLPEQRTNAFVPLQINAANLARAVIEIEVAAQIFVLRFLNECWSSRCRSVSITVSAAHAVVRATRCRCSRG